MASCSADGMIKIWEKKDDKWVCQTHLQPHTSLISKVQWAHPMFGNIIAACMYNSCVKIFKECVGGDGKPNWETLYNFNTFSRSPCDIAFCPYNHGLKLAIASLDGKVVIVTPVDSGLRNWTVEDTIEAKKNIYSVAWNKSIKKDSLFLAVGTKDDVQIWSKDASSNSWKLAFTLEDSKDIIRSVDWANNIGHSYERLATGSNDGKVRIYEMLVKPELKATLEGHNQPVCSPLLSHP